MAEPGNPDAAKSPLPEVPEDLFKAMAGRPPGVVPFIGAGVSIALDYPSGEDLARSLLEFAEAEYPDKRDTWITARAMIDAREIDKGAREIRKKVGDDSYKRWLRRDLKKWVPEPSQAHTLLDLLNFPLYLTTNYDRVLESTLYPPPEVLTYLEFGEAIAMIEQSERFIMKLHGDISRISTVRHGQDDDNKDETIVLTEGQDPPEPQEAKRAPGRKDFLKAIFSKFSVLFMGVSFTDENDYDDVLQEVLEERTKNNNGQRPKPKHFALIDSKTLDEVKDQLARNGIHPLPYDTANKHSQIWQFLAQLREDKNFQPRHGEPQGAFFSTARRPQYLVQQARHENNAHALRFLTPTVTNALTPPDFLLEDAHKRLPKFFDDLPLKGLTKDKADIEKHKWRDAVIKEMQHRSVILFEKIYQGVEVRILAEVDITREEAGDKASQALIDRFHWIIKVLQDSNLDVELRLTKRVFKDEHVASFGMALTPHGEGTDASVFYAPQATNAAFNLHIVQHNTAFARSRLRIFEEEWVRAYSERTSLEILKDLYPAGRVSKVPPADGAAKTP